MAKPRKMLGDVTGPSAVAIMALIETQSQATLGQWAVTFAQREIAPIYNARCQESTAISAALAAARQYLEGTVSLKEIKAVVKETNQLAKTYEKDVAARQAVRAAATAGSAFICLRQPLAMYFMQLQPWYMTGWASKNSRMYMTDWQKKLLPIYWHLCRQWLLPKNLSR